MWRKIALALLLSIVALAAFAQKGPVDALGFQADKLYDFNNLDAVNLFNGNLTVSVPIGIRYKVSSSLSYQFMLVYNGKIWDEETWICQDDLTGADKQCVKQYLNLRSNAGVGWRVSLGRLLPPYDTGLRDDSLTDLEWVYEGPAGDEHGLGASSTAAVQTNVHDGMRMRLVDPVTRDVDFASGEVHRFVLENLVWRLKQMRDRYDNAVNISYVYSADGKSELRWTVSDTVGRTHDIGFINYPSMSDGWSRGQNVDYMSLQAAGGTNSHAFYRFGYTEYAAQLSCYRSSIPALTHLDLPDGSSFQFAYQSSGGTCNMLGTLNSMSYPTGAVASYVLGGLYQLGAQTTICRNANTDGISLRTINDGTTTREWKYVQHGGPILPVTPQLSDLCGNGLNPDSYNGPIYWSRTSVLEPVDATNHRVRTDHYFDVYSDAAYYFHLNNPLPSIGLGLYSHTGAAGVPPAALRKLAAPVVANYSGDVDGADDPSNPRRLLATEVYDQCDVNGDCSNGRLLRTTYDVHDGLVYPNRPGGHPIDTGRLVSTRTVYADDALCSGNCYTQFTYSDDNGAGQFRATKRESNFPNANPVTTIIQYPTWTSSDLTSQTKAWLLGTYSEKTRNEGGVTRRETFCFDSDRGVMLRHRTLAGETPGPHDVLQVFVYDFHGDLQFESDYGGDVQVIDSGSTLCSIAVPAQPWYKVESSYTTKESQNGPDVYTGGSLTSSRYYDRVTGQPLGFLSLDRTIDRWTGVVTGARDTSGIGTSYSYDAVPARLHSMTAAAGALTTYAYTNSTGSAGGTWTPAKVDVSTTSTAGSLASQFVYDGMGRLIRSARQGPSGWAATQTAYDGEGRVATTSEPESTGQGPPPGPLVAANKTDYKYDALGRPTSVTAPDGSAATFGYVGERQRIRTTGIFTGGLQDTPLSTTEEYDGFGRLVSVTEKSGPTTATSVIGTDVVTTYAYDAANRLTSVKMGAGSGSGSVQNRIFDYDGRGFLRWESQPESGMTSYEYDPRGNATSKTQSGANTLFDLIYTFDAAERLRRVDGRNPFYSPSNPNDPAQPQFRVMKEFDFEDSTNDGANLRRGKLVRAARYNYGVTVNESVVKIEDIFKYSDVAGRKTDRNTTISQPGGFPSMLQSLDMSVAYDALDQVKTIKYPMCVGCGVPPTDPDRSLMTRTYAAGRLKALSGYISDISYWPNGMRNVISHSNGMADTQDVANMPRPSQISFGRYDRCLRPVFTVQPTDGQISSPGASFVLTVSVAGTGPFEFQWFNKTAGTVVGATQSITVNPTATTEYNVMVTNACGFELSQDAKVTIGSCAPPTTGYISAVAQPDGSWILTPHPEEGPSATYVWWHNPDGAVLGASKTLHVGALTVTTSYRFTITDSCGTAWADVTIQVPLPVTNGLQATAMNTTQVNISWPAIAGATQYTLERRSLGVWTTVATTSATSYSDSGLSPARTYVYRVTSNNGGKTDYDVATTMTFVAAVSGQVMTSPPFDDMLTAVNKVREAVGWPALTWSNILAAADPVPSPGQFIVPRQILSCRARINEALQALGVRTRDYSNPDLYHVEISAQAVNEVQQRAQ